MTDDIDIRSDRLPGGSFVTACLDRRIMTLADRGQSSGAIGDRWAVLCAGAVSDWVGSSQSAPGGEHPFAIERVVRLDDVPAIAAAASRRGLQNPDFLVLGAGDGEAILQGLDAKFSAETAKPRQVSAGVVRDLLQLRELLEPHAGTIDDDVVVLDGMFLSPDYPLTRLVFSGQLGMLRPSVRPEQIILIDAPAWRFFDDSVAGSGLIGPMAAIDALPVGLDESLLASLYYFRLVRSAAGIQADERRPLLSDGARYVVDYDIIGPDIVRRGRDAGSAIAMVREWDRDVDIVRGQREAVEQVAGLPVQSSQLRELIEQVSIGSDRVPPSINKVRRRLGGWFRSELRDRVGPIDPPVDDLGSTLDRVARASRELFPILQRRQREFVAEMLDEGPRLDDIARP